MEEEGPGTVPPAKVDLLDVALDGIPCGLCILDHGFRLVLWNWQFLDIYRLPPESVRTGMSMESMLESTSAAGIRGERPVSELVRIYRERLTAQRERMVVSVDDHLSDGRIINVRRTRVPEIGWVFLTQDVTTERKHERELEIRNVRLNAAVSNIAEGLCMFDADARLVISNKGYAQIYGLPPELVRPGTPHRDIVEFRLAHGMEPFEGQRPGQPRLRVSPDEMSSMTEIVQLGNERIIMIRFQPLPIGGWVGTHLDITEQRLREKELAEQNIRFDAAINNMRQGLCMFDADRRLIVSNRLYATMYGLAPDEVVPGMTLDEVVALRLRAGNEPRMGKRAYIQRRAELVRNEIVDSDLVELRDGRIISILHQPMDGGGWVAIHQDVTAQRQIEDRIKYLSRHDVLTDLPNRAQFEERLQALRPRIRRGECAAVLCIDLANFKRVNDTIGHGAGDEVLKVAAARLSSCCRELDVVARLGGDEFAILQASIEGADEAAALAHRIVKTISDPFIVQEHQFLIGVAIGIAIAPIDGSDAAVLMKKGDLALHRAKNGGSNTFHFYEAGMDAALQRTRAIEMGLRQALAGNGFRLVFQPLVNLTQKRVAAFEALLRWDEPGRGPVSPMEFIPIAEDTGLICEIGEWVLREACRVAATWPAHISVAVNISAVQFRSPGLVDQVKAALAEAGIPPERLELEVTESVLVDDERALAALHHLHDIGVSICMDDFGTGYSSLGYLRSFPFDKIKIDQSFVRDCTKDENACAIVKAVIGLGRSLGMTTTAEGVETEEQLEVVRAEGCTEAQGYLISVPLPATGVGDLLAAIEGGDRPHGSERKAS